MNQDSGGRPDPGIKPSCSDACAPTEHRSGDAHSAASTLAAAEVELDPPLSKRQLLPAEPVARGAPRELDESVTFFLPSPLAIINQAIRN